MRGLILKDFFVIRRSLIIYGALALFYFFISLNTDSAAGFASFLLFFSVMMSISPFSNDDYFHWDIYASGLPVTRAQRVGARYLFSLISLAVSLVISTLLILLNSVLGKGAPFHEQFIVLPVILVLVCIYLSFELPILYKLGAERGRIASMVIFVIPVLVMVLGGDSIVGFISNFHPTGAFLQLAPFVGIAVAVASLLLSFLLSCAIFRHKEF